MRLSFMGAAHEVTGSCYLLQAGEKNILIDCGMEQGRDIYENQPLPVAPGPVSYTHLHGGYYALGRQLGSFGWSVRKNKKPGKKGPEKRK